MKSKIDTAKLRQINLQLIRNVLLKEKYATKQQLADETGLSLASCTALLDELIENNEATELSHAVPNGGRPARRIRLNPDYQHLLLCYLEDWKSKNRIMIAVCDLKGSILKKNKLEYDSITPEDLKKAIWEEKQADSLIKTVGIGIPGVVKDNTVYECDLKAFIGMHLDELCCGLKVYSGNDMNCIAYGYYSKNNYTPDTNVTAIVWTKRAFPGSGSVVNGKVLDGFSNFAGELSYMGFEMDRKEQKRRFLSKNEFLPMAVLGLRSMIAALNPKLVVITGDLAVEHTREEYIEECAKYIPAQHIPCIEIAVDTENEYFYGLYRNVLEKLIYLQIAIY